MYFLKELERLRKDIVFPCLTVLLLLTIFFFAFGLRTVSLFGFNFPLPWPVWNSFSVLSFQQIQRDLLPSGVDLVVLNPMAAFLVQTVISFSLALVAGLPFFLYKLIGYFSPVFSPSEKIKILKICFPSLFLFIAGSLFAYFLIIPTTLDFLYQFPVALNINPFLAVNEFVFFILGLMLISGVMFLLPVLMVFLSWLDIAKRDFWKSNWRSALTIFLIFSAIITPDGSGLTMLLFSLPLSGLYFLGCYLTSK